MSNPLARFGSEIGRRTKAAEAHLFFGERNRASLGKPIQILTTSARCPLLDYKSQFRLIPNTTNVQLQPHPLCLLFKVKMALPSNTTSFSLKPVVPTDFPAMAEMCGLAFEDDRHTMLKAAHPTKPYNHAAGMGGAFEYWTSRPAGSLELTKAVDDATGEILGFVCWGMSLDKPNTDSAKSEESIATERGHGAAEANVEKPKLVVSADDILKPDSSLDPLEQLEEFTSSHLAAFQGRFKGTRCMYVITITVHPKYQGRGVGPALIKQGTDRADSEGVPCWVHSSEAGVHTYQKCGFEEDNALEIDLDSWAKKMDIKAPGGENKWGTYTFKYMVRQPKAN